MFGERYFATRERLSGVMTGISALAGETGADITGKLPFEEIEKGLGNPFLFVICGEVNAGKSTLINGLFGQDLCKVNVLPETHRVTWYRHGPVARDVEITPVLEERYRPVGFLKDFSLVDTPGTNSVVKDHQQITERFLPAADLILFVFPVTNPWGAATWDFVSKIPEGGLNRVAFIIQQKDQREPTDISVILGHMRDLSMKRIGHVPPIFAVSGKLACEAKKTAPFSRSQLEKSGFPELEDFISRQVCGSPERRALLETWRSQASSALRTVEDCIEGQTRTLDDQDRFLHQIEREIDAMRERFVARLSRHLPGVAEVFQTEAVWVSNVLSSRLGAARSTFRLFTGDRTGQEMESLFIERLQAAIEAVAEADGMEVAEACRHHWGELRERVKASMGVDLDGSHPIEETLSVAKQRFVNRLGRNAQQSIGNLKVRNQLDKVLRRRNVALKSFTFMTLALVTVAGTLGALSVPWLPFIFCGAAFLFLAGGFFTAWATRKRIVLEFRDRLLDTCGAFATTLRNDYEEALRAVFQDYGDSLTAVRKHLAKEKQAVEPRLKQWKELFLTLKAIEQEL
ncbi:dynamin family protein [Luteolibacter sp. SL250]|uniref:dynamin family protein n=1 Tax=Luteolibacter sp. SL250 TaxID=2995170 RepID=UPI0022708BB5|nr:dynamin family protein [Luteolibacter sp. SL250]WAC21705.1 dynamin family protein [Luteolibacter sp. SL250]